MEYLWDILTYVITAYLLSTFFLLGAGKYIQAWSSIRPVYLGTANKVAAIAVLLRMLVLLGLSIQTSEINSVVFTFPPVLVFLVVFPSIFSLIILFGKRSPDGLTFLLLLISLILARVVEFTATYFFAEVDVYFAERMSKVPYAEVLITTMLYFAACYFYARRKTDRTTSS